MINNHLNQMLKEHYESRKLPNSQATKILAKCDVARTAYRWRVRAITAISLAATTMIALAIVLYGTLTTEPATQMQVQAPPPPETPAAHQPKLVAVMIHATDCPNSKAMEPVFAKLQEDFIGESVLFIKFDYSSDCARRQAELLSRDLGLGEVFEHYKKTGDIVLVSPRGEVREVLDRNISIATATKTVRKNVDRTL